GGGEGPSSNTIMVTTLALAPGAPAAKGPTNVTSSGFTANWNTVVGAASYDLDVALDSAFTAFVGQYNNYNAGPATSCAVGGVQEATLYFYRVRGRSSGGPGPNSNIVTATTLRSNPTKYTVAKTVSFGSASIPLNQHTSADYRLIGIPGNWNTPMAGVLGGVQGTDWEVYWDNGTPVKSPAYFVRLTSGDTRFNATTGRAFWLLHLGDWVLQPQSVDAAPLDTAANAVIPLTGGQGWNLVTNPFLFSIPWAQITAANGIHDTAYAYNSSGWVAAQSFDPYSGYLFFNRSGKSSLLVPLNSALPRQSVRKQSDPSSWRLDVIARCEGRTDQTTSFGVSPGALAGLDAFDQWKPRQVEGFPEVYFRRPEWDGRFPCFAADIRPPGGLIDIWEMTVRSDNLKPTDVEFRGVDGIPAACDVVLIDELSLRAQDLRIQSTYHLIPHATSTQLNVAVGSPAAVRALSSGVLPVKFSLLRNYPNPFNAYTTVPVDVPFQSYVTVDVFDVLGRLVARLHDGDMSQGRHFVRWDGTNNRGGGVASGAYFIRLMVRNGPTLVSSMNLLK
ncbi:MAG TPA: FlgD immunoglobulin-like domain containing protein, partial [Bacteroidota bacterium]|nr:FlgD immunoglobulin-like domain containing protein [Bacteroidota bacterium]